MSHLLSLLENANPPETSTVEKLLKEKSNALKETDPKGKTPLHIAAEKNLLEIAQLLFQYGAENIITAKDRDGYIPLHFAVETGDLDMVMLLLKRGASLKDRVSATNQMDEKAIKQIIDLAKAPDTKYSEIFESLTAYIQKMLNKKKIKQMVDTASVHGHTPLHLATQGDLDMVMLLLACGATVSPKDQNNATPLDWAVEQGKIDIMELLLMQGARCQLKESLYIQVLLIAAMEERPVLLKGVLKQGFNIKVSEKDQITPFTSITQEQGLDIVDILQKAAAACNLKAEVNNMLLLLAAAENRPELLAHVLEEGANIQAVTLEGKTALHLISENGHPEQMKLLIGYNAEVDTRDGTSSTPLHLAAKNGHANAVRMLLKFCSPPVNARDENGNTALILAAQSGDLDMVKRLLNNGADIEIMNTKGKTALDVAAENAKLEDESVGIVQLLLNHTPKLYGLFNTDNTLLQFAAAEGHVALLKCLITLEYDIKVANTQGKTALHLAAERNHLEVARLLLKAQAATDVQDKNDNTPLQIAIKRRHPGIVKLLLKAKAATNIADKNHDLPPQDSVKKGDLPTQDSAEVEKGDLPLQVAVKKGDSHIVELLLKAKAETDVQDTKGNTPLRVAVDNSDLKIVRLLLTFHADTEIVNSKKETVLHGAAKRGSSEIIELLLNHGANIHSENENNPPLHSAILSRRVNATQILLQRGAYFGKDPSISVLSSFIGLMSFGLETKPDKDIDYLMDRISNSKAQKSLITARDDLKKDIDTLSGSQIQPSEISNFLKSMDYILTKLQQFQNLTSRDKNKRESDVKNPEAIDSKVKKLEKSLGYNPHKSSEIDPHNKKVENDLHEKFGLEPKEAKKFISILADNRKDKWRMFNSIRATRYGPKQAPKAARTAPQTSLRLSR